VINWRDIRTVKALRTFTSEFNALAWVEKEPILADMNKELDDFRNLEVIARDGLREKPRQVEKPLRKRRRRRQ